MTRRFSMCAAALFTAVMFVQPTLAQDWKLFGSSGNSEGLCDPLDFHCINLSDDENLYAIDISDGSTEYVRGLRNNVDVEVYAGGWTGPFWGVAYRDGQSIAYNPNDGLLYHRNGTTGYRDAVDDPRSYDTRLIETYDPGPAADFTVDPVKIYNSLTDRPGGPVNDRLDPFHPIDGTIWEESRSFTWNPVDDYFILADNDGDIGYWDPTNGATTDAAVHVTTNAITHRGISWYTTNLDGTGAQRLFSGVNDESPGNVFYELDSDSASGTYLQPLALSSEINLIGGPVGATVDQTQGMVQNPETGDLYSVITLSIGERHLIRYNQADVDAFNPSTDMSINAQYLGPTGVDLTSIAFVPAPIPSDSDLIWNDPAGGSFQTSDNWSPSLVPTATDNAIFDLDDVYTVTFAGDAETAAVNVYTDDVTWDLNGHTHAHDDVTTLGDQSGDSGHLTVVDGTVTSRDVVIAATAGSEGSLTVSNGAVWSHPLKTMFASFRGDGTLTIENGGSVHSMRGLTSIHTGSTGQAIVTGPGSTWTLSGGLSVGGSGNGELHVRDGGTVSAASLLAIIHGTIDVTGTDSLLAVAGRLDLGGNGPVTLQVTDGGSVTADNIVLKHGIITVSDSDSSISIDDELYLRGGDLTVSDGGVVTSQFRADLGSGNTEITGTGAMLDVANRLETIGSLTISAGGTVKAGSSDIAPGRHRTGSAVVTGAGSTWTQTGELRVGAESRATLDINAGGVVNSSNGVIARFDRSVSQVMISGTDSAWNMTGSLYVGGKSDEAGGEADLSVSEGAVASAAGSVLVWQNGSIHLDGGEVEATDATIHGTLDGSGLWDVDNTTSQGTISPGTISPGTSTGKITIDGALVLGAASTLEIDVNGSSAGTDYDVLEITGAATLDGTVIVTLDEGFTPAEGEVFAVVTFGSRGGTSFDSISDVSLADNRALLVDYTATELRLVATYFGDGNLDGVVDHLDYMIWAGNYGDDPAADPPGSPLTGDFNNDGAVDGLDYLVWAGNFGQGPLVGVAVPEPTTLCLALVGVFSVLARARGKRD